MVDAAGKEDFKSEFPWLSKAALTAASRLAPDQVIEELTSALQSKDTGLSRTATRSLAKQMHLIPGAAFEGLLESGRASHVRKNALSLALRTNKWDRLAIALKYATDGDERISGIATNAIERWLRRYNQSWVIPSAEQLRKVSEAFEKARSHPKWGNHPELRQLITESNGTKCDRWTLIARPGATSALPF